MQDDLGDRMKEYENKTSVKLMPMLPTFARVDGRSFHTFTKGMAKPYDIKFVNVMQETAKLLAEETNATMAYTQSDEITLMWYSDIYKSQIWFDGKHSKMVSQIAALATLYFNQQCEKLFSAFYTRRNPTFDGRVWQVPNKQEAVNVFIWREQDATRNSILSAAQNVMSHKEMHGMNCDKLQEILFQHGIIWNDYPAFFKRGTYIQRTKTTRPFTADEIEKLPEKHEARKNPHLWIERTNFEMVSLPPILTIENIEDVIFYGDNAVSKQEKTNET